MGNGRCVLEIYAAKVGYLRFDWESHNFNHGMIYICNGQEREG